MYRDVDVEGEINTQCLEKGEGSSSYQSRVHEFISCHRHRHLNHPQRSPGRRQSH